MWVRIMRWLGLLLLPLCATAAQTAPVTGLGRPFASHFDLTSFTLHPASINTSFQSDGDDDDRWLVHDLDPPPGPPADPPKIRIRGQHLKVRIPL